MKYDERWVFREGSSKMQDVNGKVAVITGAASGIGRGMAEVFAAAGMKVVASDIEEPALQATVAHLREAGHEIHPVVTDVAKLSAVEALAKEAIAKYGKVHVLCNNAGIGAGGGPIWEGSLDDWDWTVDVNLKSVVYGIRAFVPHMLAHGEPGHVVNTASLAGLISGSNNTAYAMTKAGVVSLSEQLYLQLAQAKGQLSASVLCPSWVNTNIMHSERNRPTEQSSPQTPVGPTTQIMQEWVAEQVRGGLEPLDVGQIVLQAMKDNRFYILTHPEWTGMIETRMRNILSGKNPELVLPPGGESLVERLMRLRPDTTSS